MCKASYSDLYCRMYSSKDCRIGKRQLKKKDNIRDSRPLSVLTLNLKFTSLTSNKKMSRFWTLTLDGCNKGSWKHTILPWSGPESGPRPAHLVSRKQQHHQVMFPGVILWVTWPNLPLHSLSDEVPWMWDEIKGKSNIAWENCLTLLFQQRH